MAPRRARAQTPFRAADATKLVDTFFSETPPGHEALSDTDKQVLDIAPNVIEWAVGGSWLNAPELYEFPRSYQTLRDYFEIRCPKCNPGGVGPGQPGDLMPDNVPRTRAYMESEVLLRWSWDYLEEVCPKCSVTKSELIEVGLCRGYNQMHLLVGMRSGKSMTAGYAGTWVEHFMLGVGHRHPNGLAGYFGITQAEIFEMTFLASSDVQSQDTVWAKFTGLRTSAPWFRRYVAWVKLREKAQPRFGMRLWEYEEGVKKIRNEHPKIRLIINSLNSNSGSLVGRTRVFGAVDELARMKATEGVQSAREIYRGVERALKTVRTQVQLYGGVPWMGSMLSVTSPMSRDDVAMQLYTRSAEISRMYAKKYATWQFNPKQPKKVFDDDFRKDPVGAERDFGANPPGAASPFVHDEARWWTECISTFHGAPELFLQSAPARFVRAPLFQVTYPRWQNQLGTRYVGLELSDPRLQVDTYDYVCAFDPALNFDGYSLCLARRELDANRQWVTVVCLIARVLAEPGEEVHFGSVVAVVKRLRDCVRLVRTEWDQWQSVQAIQDLRDAGIVSERYSLSDSDYQSFLVASYSGQIVMLPPPPEEVDYADPIQNRPVWPIRWRVEPPRMSGATLAAYELFGLERNPKTGRVENPRKGRLRGYDSDDTIRVVVHAHHMLSAPGFEERTQPRRQDARRARVEMSPIHAHGGQYVPSSAWRSRR